MKHDTFKKIKAAYAGVGQERPMNWHAKKTMLGPCSVVKLAETLATFAPYLLTAYNCFFVETQYGVAVVTCVTDLGIRIEYFTGSVALDYEWLHFTNGTFLGDAQTSRTLVPQPQDL